jgi:hypothetical protein
MWANIRGLWVNFVRILKHLKGMFAGDRYQRSSHFTNAAYKILFSDMNLALKGFLKIFSLKYFFLTPKKSFLQICKTDF